MQRASDLLLGVSIFTDPIKINNCACLAMDELGSLGFKGEPFWDKHKDGYEILNEIEYLKKYGRVDEIVKMVEVGEPQILPSFDSCQDQLLASNENSEQRLRIESSRDMTSVNMSPNNIVELLMDVNQWSKAFYNIVSRATILGSLSDGVAGSYNGKLHVMSAEFHLPSPVVPTRKCSFARYCKQLDEDKWVVVDVSLENIFPSPSNNLRKRPSGCLIMGMPDGTSQVIWIEHVKANHSNMNNLFKPLVNSSWAFGATRWLASLVRHTQWAEALKDTKLVAINQVNIPQTGRTSFLKLADRLMRNFCANLSANTSNPWISLVAFRDSPDVKFMFENNMAATANKHHGICVLFSTTIWLNVSPNRLFTFLSDPKSRNKWDILSQTLSIQEFARMFTDEHPENHVSLLRATNSKDETEIFYLQESYADSSTSYVVYAPIDESTLAYLTKGSNPDSVLVFPSGFAIIPGGLPKNNDQRRKYNSSTSNNIVDNESLLTISFQIIDKNTFTPPSIPDESVRTIYKIITETVTAIKDALLYDGHLNN